MRHTRLTLAACCLLAAACSNHTLIDEQRSFANNVWNRFTPEVFDLNIPGADQYYHIDFTIELDTAAFRYNDLPLIVDIYSDDGIHRHMAPKVPVKENGRWKGEIRNGYRTVSTRAYNFFTFNQPGHYRYEIKQATSQYDLEGIHSIAVRIEQAKLEYDKL